MGLEAVAVQHATRHKFNIWDRRNAMNVQDSRLFTSEGQVSHIINTLLKGIGVSVFKENKMEMYSSVGYIFSHVSGVP
jgi:hypothetical protein